MFTRLHALILAGAALAVTPALADEPPIALPPVSVTDQAPQDDQKSYVASHDTTATKTDTPIMETPLSIQVITPQLLEDQQDITLAQALRNVSGVSVADGNIGNDGEVAAGVMVRGFQEMTYYRDGFRIDSANTGGDYIGPLQFANIASVDVLKGPSAMLYGLVEPGGVVNIITKQPLDTPYYSIEQQIGSLELYRTVIDATGPLNNDGTVLYRMNASYTDNGAPFGSVIDLTHEENYFLAPVVKWNFDASTWVEWEGQYNHDRVSNFFAFDPLLNGAFVTVPRSVNYNEKDPSVANDAFSAVTWSHEFGQDWSIKQQIVVDREGGLSYAAYPAAIAGTEAAPQVERFMGYVRVPQLTTSTEVDVVGHVTIFGTENTLLLGGDFYRLNGHYTSYFGETSTVDMFYPVHPGVISGALSPTGAYTFAQNTAGLYVQDQIKLPYDLFAMAGARYQHIAQREDVSPDTLSDLTPYAVPLSAQKVTPRAGLLWRPRAWVSVYGNYSEGFGPNYGLIPPGIIAPPTGARSWEAGLKLEFFNGKLRATADYYNLVKTNITTQDPLNTAFSLLIGKAKSKGPELDIAGEILPGWNLTANFSNEDVVVLDAEPGAYPPAGQRFPNVPRNQASLWTTYEFQSAPLNGLKIGGGYVYTGSKPIADSSLSPEGTFPNVKSAGIVNVMAAYGFAVGGRKITAQLNIDNLLDKTYYLSSANFSPPGPGYQAAYRSYGGPFSALGSLKAEF